ncbi:MAG: hypothetical protein ACR2HX_25215 [Pyrinomonadaceae bacterium]
MTVTIIFCLLLATRFPTDTSNRGPLLTATQFATPTLDLTLAAKPAQRAAAAPRPSPSLLAVKAPALPLPVPVPTPAYDPKSYIRAAVGNSITVRAKKGEDLASLINSAQEKNVATIKIAGGGSIKNQVRLRRHTVFDSSTYSCDTRGRDEVVAGNTNNSVWYGCFLVDDNVLVEGTWRPPVALEDFFRNPSAATLAKVQALTPDQLAGTGTTILEPNFHTKLPSITVFQAYQDAVSVQHERETKNITIMGFHVVGRQPVYDGGSRLTIAFGNCVNCAAMYNYLDNTRSIGIQFGGYGGNGKYANHFLAWRNVLSRVAAANIAVVNGENGLIAENYSLKLGHQGFGGGISGFDLETNADDDHAKNIWVMNGLFDYEGSSQNSAGNAINFQAPGVKGSTGGIYAVNNWIIGGRNDAVHRYMANGFFVNSVNGVTIKNNYVYKTGQTAVQWYGSGRGTGTGSIIEDNWFDATGGGGNPSILLIKASGVTVRRNRFTLDPDTKFGTDLRIRDCGGTKNVFLDNSNGPIRISVVTNGCP